MKFRMAFAGFGVVAQGLTELLIEKKSLLKQQYGMEWDILAISDLHKGSILDPKGLDMPSVLAHLKKKQTLKGYPAPTTGFNVMEMIDQAPANMLVEVTYTNVKTGQPAANHIKKALHKKWHVATTNKGPIINYGKELIQLAKDNNIGLGFEGVVMSGTPTIGLVMRNLAGSCFSEIKGILNGTTNYILSEMEKGLTYSIALHQAQQLGYAEADPTSDVEGWDALGKIIILSHLLMNSHITLDEAHRQGITHITLQDIKEAQKNDQRYKLLARSTQKDGNITVSVMPELIPQGDPLASVQGATNALTLSTDTLGDITIIGAGAGKRETGYSLLTDILYINHHFGRQ